jgi:AraC family transcriptional regulator of adaptative response/methylated-DNA-[protein]-cysteine methyltransferase
MNLMISENISRPALLRTRGNVESDTISYGMSTSDLGELLVARSIKGVCAILIGCCPEELDLGLAARFPKADLVADKADVHDDLAKVISFMDKPANGLYLPLDMRGTPFHRRVWEKLRAIPVGRTVTYTDVAYWVGPLTSARAVAGACASNLLALAVPCHRVVRGNGDLGGYRWGVERKREMIRKEALA